MNRQFIKTALLIGILAISLANCKSKDEKDSPNANDAKTAEDANATNRSADSTAGAEGTEPNDVKPVDTTGAEDSSASNRLLDGAADELFAQLNDSMKSVRYPDGEAIEGFAYKKWEIPNKKDFVNWVKGAGAVLKKGIDELPAMYTLEIAGHTDTVGPETPIGGKRGNMFYSAQRAKEVKQALVKLGFPEKRIVTKAMGSSDTIPGIDGESGQNRRVTFKLLKKEPDMSEAETTKDAELEDAENDKSK